MVETTYLMSVILVAAAVTWGLRALPFAVLAPMRNSTLLPYLAERLPMGVMVILAVYSLRHVDVGDAASVLPAAVGVIVTTALHLWRQNMILSLVAGTATYVVLASVVFA